MEEEKFENESLKTEDLEEQEGFAGAARKEQLASQRDNKFANRDLEKKTLQLQEEFEKILGELN